MGNATQEEAHAAGGLPLELLKENQGRLIDWGAGNWALGLAGEGRLPRPLRRGQGGTRCPASN